MIATLLKKGRSQLAQAIAEVRRLDERRAEIQSELNARIDVSYFDARFAQSAKQYEASRSPDDLFDQLLAELVAKEARAKAFMASKVKQYDGVDACFVRACPEYRDALSNLCGLRLQVAKEKLEAVTEQETKRLEAKGLAHRIAEAPEVREAVSEVKRFEFLAKRISSDAAEIVWQRAQTLLAE